VTDAVLAVGCAALGLIVGVFLNVVIDRVPAKQPLLPLRSPSAAPEAGAGERAEAHRRPARHVVVPVANAALFAGVAVRFGPDWVVPAYLVFFASLLAISVIDLQLQIIPNRVVYPTIFVTIPLLTLAALVEDDWSAWQRALISGALAWLALLVIHLVSPGGMGFGDVRLSFILGMFLGWISYGHVLTGLFLGFLLGAVVGGGLVLVRLRARTDHVPFGPFLAAGAALAVFVGGPLVRAWLG
jgi:leader peptidase (prepilin peptidase)/N-methyltransferase